MSDGDVHRRHIIVSSARQQQHTAMKLHRMARNGVEISTKIICHILHPSAAGKLTNNRRSFELRFVAYNPTMKPCLAGGGSGASRTDGADGGVIGPEDPAEKGNANARRHDQMSRNRRCRQQNMPWEMSSDFGARTARGRQPGGRRRPARRGRRRGRRHFPLGSLAMGGVPVQHLPSVAVVCGWAAAGAGGSVRRRGLSRQTETVSEARRILYTEREGLYLFNATTPKKG